MTTSCTTSATYTLTQQIELTVTLRHDSNPDVRGGYWSDIKRSRPGTSVVNSFAEASAVCQRYIKDNDLGGGNWTGGEIFNVQGIKIGYVSYNGRVWEVPGEYVEIV